MSNFIQSASYLVKSMVFLSWFGGKTSNAKITFKHGKPLFSDLEDHIWPRNPK